MNLKCFARRRRLSLQVFWTVGREFLQEDTPLSHYNQKNHLYEVISRKEG